MRAAPLPAGVNHLGHFALTNALLPALQRSAPSRVINVASIAQNFAPPEGVPFDDLSGDKSYDPVQR